ncbi:hypothetical protein HKX48_006562 [Thoreauomyces humboldtii]|nr:hypothetical protein HKX48_006562 [Thoreauomyces humboldtii]
MWGIELYSYAFRHSNLLESSNSEHALLKAMQAEADSAGLALTQPIRREAIEETVGSVPWRDSVNLEDDHVGSPEAGALAINSMGSSLDSLAGADLAEEVRSDSRNEPLFLVNASADTHITQELQLQRAEEKHLTAEHTDLIKLQREESGEHASLQFQLDSLHARKTGSVRAVRQMKQQARDLHEKSKRVVTWLTSDGKAAYEKEKERAAALMARLQALMATHEALQKSLEAALASRASSLRDREFSARAVSAEEKPLRAQVDQLTAEIGSLNERLDDQERLLEEKKAKRDLRMLQMLEEEEAHRKRELQMLLASLRRQKGSMAVTVEELGELLTLELAGSGLGKVRVALFGSVMHLFQ